MYTLMIILHVVVSFALILIVLTNTVAKRLQQEGIW